MSPEPADSLPPAHLRAYGAAGPSSSLSAVTIRARTLARCACNMSLQHTCALLLQQEPTTLHLQQEARTLKRRVLGMRTCTKGMVYWKGRWRWRAKQVWCAQANAGAWGGPGGEQSLAFACSLKLRQTRIPVRTTGAADRRSGGGTSRD